MKLMHTVAALALAATTTTTFAWYAAPYQPVAPGADPQTVMAQHDQAMRAAFEAQRQFAAQQMNQMPPPPARPDFPARPAFAAAPEFPAMPPFGQYPAAPEFPPMPEFGQYPALPESFEARRKEIDAYRAQAKQRMEERRAAMQHWREARRAAYERAYPMPTQQQAPATATTQTQ